MRTDSNAGAATRGPWMLQMGYWSDAMAANGEGPDVFFTVVDAPGQLVLLDAAEMLLEAWDDKYGGDAYGFGEKLSRGDLFWSCAPRPS